LYGLFVESERKNNEASLACNEGTWVCLTNSEVDEDGKSWSIPLIQGNVTLILGPSSHPDHAPSQLQIMVHGAKVDLNVVFACSEVDRVELIDAPSHHNTLRFMWASRYGCHLNDKSRTRRRKSKSTLNTWTSEEQESNDSDDSESDHEGDEDTELLPSDSRKVRTSIAFVVAFIVLIIICGSALASSTRARHSTVEALRNVSYSVISVLAEVGLKLQPLGRSLNSLTSKAMSSVRSRPGDDHFVPWAQEDTALDSDIMVNGFGQAGAYPLDEEGQWVASSEYIPLATSPRFGTGRRFQSYGTTLGVETFHERGVMSRMRKYFKM